MVVYSFAQTESIITSGVSEIGGCFTSSSSEIALTSPTKYSSPFDICGFQKVTAIIEVAAVHLLGLNLMSREDFARQGSCPGCPTPQLGLAVRTSSSPDDSRSPSGWHNLLVDFWHCYVPPEHWNQGTRRKFKPKEMKFPETGTQQWNSQEVKK